MCTRTSNVQIKESAQQMTVNTDSLENVLTDGNCSPEERLRIRDELSWTYLETDIERAAELSRQGLKLAQEMEDWYYTARFYSHLGFSHYYRSCFDSALICFNDMLALAETVKRICPETAPEIETDAYTGIGIAYDAQGKLKETVHFYLKGLDIAERNGLIAEQELLYGNLGRVYYCLKNIDKAQYYYQKDIELCRLLSDSSKMTYACLGLSSIALDRQQYDEALEYAETAFALAMNHPHSTLELKIFSLQTLAEIHIRGYKDYSRALEYAREAFRYAGQWNSPVHKANSLRQMSLAYLQQGEYAAAEQTALQALENDSSDIYANALLYEYITRANIGTGNRDRALAAFDRQIALNRNYSGKNYQTAISEMEVKYETEKKEMQIAAVKSENRMMMITGAVIITLLTSLAGGLFVLYRYILGRKRYLEQRAEKLEQEKQLVATQAVLDGETQERTRLARDLHDGLGSMLTGVKLNLESARGHISAGRANIETFERALTILNESMSELRRVAHHLMPETLTRFGLKPAIDDFCRSLSPDIVFEYFGNTERLDIKLEVMIYRTVHELVNNALKHAHASQIIVQITQETGYIACCVHDNGCGFDISADTQGTGLSNIRTRVASFGGTIRIDASAGTGTEINVEIPIYDF
jgi:signal transduction histidine kinase